MTDEEKVTFLELERLAKLANKAEFEANWTGNVEDQEALQNALKEANAAYDKARDAFVEKRDKKQE